VDASAYSASIRNNAEPGALPPISLADCLKKQPTDLQRPDTDLRGARAPCLSLSVRRQMRGLLTHFPEKGKTGSMSLREIDFGNLAEWVSAIAAIVTAVIVFVQIQDLRRTVQNQTSQAVYSEMLSLDRFFFQNCEFREYFYEGQESPADKMAQARIVAELLCDLADYVCLQKKTMAPDTFKEWQTYMRFLSHH